jgi:non-specific serine/threonine protein kinase/serine/threonine-protein kinase
VLRRALAPDRAERYDSANALAEDLDRYRQHRPLRAMPASRFYIARTFLHRHRLGIAAAALIVGALVVGIAVAIGGMRQAQRSADIARTEAAKAEKVADFARSMLAGIDPDRARGMDRGLMRLALNAAADRAGHELADQPAVRETIEHTIADSYAAIGEYPLALEHYDKALTAARVAGVGASERGRLLLRHAEMSSYQGHYDEALKGATDALAIVKADASDKRSELFIENRLAGIECDAGHSEDARQRYQRVLDAQRSAFGAEDPDTLASIDGLARADTDLARYDDARTLYDGLIKSYRKMFGDEHSKTLGAINGLAVVDLESKNDVEAEKLLAPMLAIDERVFGPEHPVTQGAINNLGGAIRGQGRNEEARPYYERSLQLSYKLYGADSYAVVVGEGNLALLLRDAGELAEAEKHARIAVARSDKAFGTENAYRGVMHDTLATVLTKEKRFVDAERELDVAWNILFNAKEFGQKHPRSQEVVDHYIDLYAAWNKPDREATWRARKGG